MIAYETYKPISLPWLKSVPSHWDMVRNKVVMQESKTTVGKESSKYTLLSLTKRGIIIRDLSQMKGKFPSDFGTYKTVEDGQIIFCLFDIDETPRTVGLSHHSGMITGAYDVFDISGINSDYLQYYYLSLDNVKAMRPLYTGLRKVIGMTTFLQTSLPLPPREEQDQIVRYLDWQVSKVNKLIAAKKKQIKLLQEQKQAMINAAVTQGGEAWKEISLGNLGSFRKGYGGTRADDAEEGVACIRYGDIYRTGVYVLESPVTRIDAVAAKTYARIYKSEVIFPLSGETKEDIGMAMVNHISEDTWCSGDCAVFASNGKILPEFLAYAVRCPYLVQQRASMAKGDIIVHLSTSAIRRLRILVPPVDVQGIIVTKIRAMQSKTDRILSAIEQQLSFLQEFHTRLISDVVTGKLDVRDVVVPDCESVEEDASEVEFTDDELGISEAEEP